MNSGYFEPPDRSPWPGNGPGDVAFPVDWQAVDSPLADDDLREMSDPGVGGWSRVEGWLREHVRSEGGPPPLVDPDALAWYQPIHYFATDWGIYIRESAVLELAAYILETVPPERRFDRDVFFGAVRLGLGVLYLHEAFHHRVESFATGLEIAERSKRYCAYFDAVYKPLAASRSPEQLEETLATAESYRRLREKVYSRSVPNEVRKLARLRLQTWIEALPPGYNRAPSFFPGSPFESGVQELCSRVQEATTAPSRPHHEWRLASALRRQSVQLQDDHLGRCSVGRATIHPVVRSGRLRRAVGVDTPIHEGAVGEIRLRADSGFEAPQTREGRYADLDRPGKP